jgi:hypothetical protein
LAHADPTIPSRGISSRFDTTLVAAATKVPTM